MRTRLSILASAAALFAATPASSAVIFQAGSGGPLPGETLYANFDGTGPLPTGSGFITQSANLNAQGAKPAFGSTGNYLAVLAGGVANFSFATPLDQLSFVYGSADTYNTLTVFFLGGGSQSFTGSQLVGAGNATGSTTLAAANGYLTLNGFANPIIGLRLESSQNSFEIDNLRVINAVPEPGTWAMMLLGFGAVGYAMRRRKPRAVLQMA